MASSYNWKFTSCKIAKEKLREFGIDLQVEIVSITTDDAGVMRKASVR